MQPLCKTVWKFLKNLNIELPYDPAPGYISEENKSTTLKRYMQNNVHSSIIYNCQDMEATKCPSTDKWIKKMGYIYIYTTKLEQKNLKICMETQKTLNGQSNLEEKNK